MTQINDPKLKPCPFCGEDAAIWYYPANERINLKESYYVGCTNDHCGCEMEHDGGWKTYDDAMNAWNRRGNYSEIPTGSTTKNDLGVDREDAVVRLNALKQFIGYDKDSEIVKATQKSLDMAIKALEQEPKAGHWIKGYTFPDGAYWKCDKCNELIKVKIPMRYCNNCGAKMVEPQEGEGCTK